jgi:hypothetical protein
MSARTSTGGSGGASRVRPNLGQGADRDIRDAEFRRAYQPRPRRRWTGRARRGIGRQGQLRSPCLPIAWKTLEEPFSACTFRRLGSNPDAGLGPNLGRRPTAARPIDPAIATTTHFGPAPQRRRRASQCADGSRTHVDGFKRPVLSGIPDRDWGISHDLLSVFDPSSPTVCP